MNAKTSVVVLAWNGEKFLDDCLTALLTQECALFEVIVVDNASTDESRLIVGKYVPPVRIISNLSNLGFAGGSNIGLREAKGDIVVLLNQDTVVAPGWLGALVDTFTHPAIGIVGCKIYYPGTRKLQHAGARVQSGNALPYHLGWGEDDQGQFDTLADADYVTGAAFAIHRRVFERLGGLDEDFHPAFFEDIDLCYRARRAGFRIVYQPKAMLYHHETPSLPATSFERAIAFQRNRVRFILRHWSFAELADFFSAEQSATRCVERLDDAIACVRAYWINLLSLPVIATQRQLDATLGEPFGDGERAWLIERLEALHALAFNRVRELTERTYVQRAEYDRLNLLLCNLENDATLREPLLSSQVPWLGRGIDWVRSLFFSLVVRHYVKPTMDQQSRLNRRMLKLIEAMQAQNEVLMRVQAIQESENADVANAMRALTTRWGRLDSASPGFKNTQEKEGS